MSSDFIVCDQGCIVNLYFSFIYSILSVYIIYFRFWGVFRRFILDLSKNKISSSEEYQFYNEMIMNLLNSMKNEQIIISDIYYSNPVDIELFSNISILMNIKNDQIKEHYQLNTLCLLLKKLK